MTPTVTAVDAHEGVTGNERLTGAAAAVLFVLLFVEGVTIATLDSTMPVHVFVGAMLIPPVLLKVFATSYRMVRYYTGSAPYVERGAPPTYLRLLGPVVVVSTVVVLATGVVLIAARGADWARGLHTASFLVFFFSTAVHVLSHLRRTAALAKADLRPGPPVAGRRTRATALVAALVVGIGLGAVALATGHLERHPEGDRRGSVDDG
jgi:hypothetical protein